MRVVEHGDITRREFARMAVAAGMAAVTAANASAQQRLTETNVDIKTMDGTCDAAFIHPAVGAYPAVLMWTDAFGLRPATREMARRLAADGYAVLVPNPFYRTARAPLFDDASKINVVDPVQVARLRPLMNSVAAAGVAERDAAALIAWLDTQRQVDRSRKAGTTGYGMGGALAVRTAAAVPGRVGAGASFHAYDLVTANADSPHLLAPKIKGRMYFGVAGEDDRQQPKTTTTLREAFTAAKVPVDVEVYPDAPHGWCVPDMPLLPSGQPLYSKADAERARVRLIAVYKRALV